MFEESGSSSEDDDDDDTEETTTLIQRLSTEDVAVIQKARDEGRGVSLAWFLGKAIQHNGRECPVELPWYTSSACELVARKLRLVWLISAWSGRKARRASRRESRAQRTPHARVVTLTEPASSTMV